MNSLTATQQNSIVENIQAEFGSTLSLEEFTDVLLGLLEDVAGFETSSEHTVNTLTQQLWSQYHD